MAHLSPRQRVCAALTHQSPDRVPVDFLATPEVWRKLIDALGSGLPGVPASPYFEADREAVLRHLQVDCRVVSYDMFCAPPPAALQPGAQVDWWGSLSRSTPNRMWCQRLPDDTRRYHQAAEMLRHLGVRSVRLMTNNPEKLERTKYDPVVRKRVKYTEGKIK